MKTIGKIAALENKPTTIDEFYFWTNPKCILDPFDVVVVEHINNSITLVYWAKLREGNNQ